MTLFKNKYRIESTRLKGWDYSCPGLYFVTICTKNRECFFGDVINGEMDLTPIGEIVAEEWRKTPAIRSNVQLDEWVVMPNHIHGIIWITHQVETSRWDVSSWRDVSTRAVEVSRQGETSRRDVSTRAVEVSRQGETSHRDVSTRAVEASRQRETSHRDVSTPPRLKANSLGSILGQIKTACTKRIHAAGFVDFDWQERYHDEIVRNERSLDAIRKYILDNPANWEKDKDNPAGIRM